MEVFIHAEAVAAPVAMVSLSIKEAFLKIWVV